MYTIHPKHADLLGITSFWKKRNGRVGEGVDEEREGQGPGLRESGCECCQVGKSKFLGKGRR